MNAGSKPAPQKGGGIFLAAENLPSVGKHKQHRDLLLEFFRFPRRWTIFRKFMKSLRFTETCGIVRYNC